MKTSPAFWPMVLGLGVLSSVYFAADRYFAQRDMNERLNASLAEVHGALDLAARHPKVFAQKNGEAADLKKIVQASGTRHGVAVVYLNETERESGDKMNERNVVVRIVNVPHPNFVQFLAEIERLGQGARFKDIRMKPSDERTGVYQEAEAILALRTPRAQQ